MAAQQLGSAKARWGLQPTDVCALPSNGSERSVTFYEEDCSKTQYVDEGFYNPSHPSAENEPKKTRTRSTSEVEGDESNLNDEMGRRLNKMVPIPHVPKVNGKMPSHDEVTSDHQRLINRLQLYDLEEVKILGDGNCQFRSLSDQIYRTPEHHKFVREQVVEQLKSQPDLYKNYVPMAYSDYLKTMSKSGEWGDHVTLQAAADFYGVKIFVITSYKDTCYIEILPKVEKSKRTMFLSFWAEVHYNSIRRLGG